MRDSAVTNYYLHAGWRDGMRPDVSSTTANFAGVVCITTTPSVGAATVSQTIANYVTTHDTSWMDTSDACGGWRQSTWNPNFFFAVAGPAHTTFDLGFSYQCPTGYRWASTLEGLHAFTNQYNIPTYVMHSQCGHNGYYWNSRYQVYFRFSDSGTYCSYKHAGNLDSCNACGCFFCA
jgi:hypothetical protein